MHNLFKVTDSPRTDVSQIDIRILFFLFLILVLSAFVGFNITRLPPLVPLGVISAIVIGIITLVNTNFGLCILIFSMLFSPEIPIAQLTERTVVFRLDDFLIIAVFFVWLAKMALTKELALFKHAPLNRPIMFYLVTSIFSTLLGIVAGDVEAKTSVFYILKYIEYAMIYFLFVNNLQHMKQLKMFMVCFLVTFFIIGIYTYTQIGHMPRPTAPFEGEHPEPNTLGGYLLLALSVTIGLFLHSSSPLMKSILGALVCFNIYPFLMTLSRGSYFGFAFAYLIFLLTAKKGKLFLLALLLVAILLFPFITPQSVIERVVSSFKGTHQFEIGGMGFQLETSAAVRFYNYKFALQHLKKRPLFGYGVTGLGLIDSQYARVIAELGIVGSVIFIWLIYSIIRNTLFVYQNTMDEYSRGLSLGFFCGFMGLLALGIAANVFVIVRISEPLWFLAACVVMLPRLSESEEAYEEEYSDIT
jgi:hypothetical protein